VDEVDPSGLGGGFLGINITIGGYCWRYVTCSGSTPKAHIDQVIANGAAGVLNAVTGGNGQTVAGWLGIACNADWSSSATAIGNGIGTVATLGLPEGDVADLVTDASADVVRATEDAGATVRGGENAFTAYGRAAHTAYDYGPGFEKEFVLENGQRADAVNLATREVIELKPNNPAAIARGLRQAEGYAQQLTEEYPGTPFSYSVVTYDRP